MCKVLTESTTPVNKKFALRERKRMTQCKSINFECYKSKYGSNDKKLFTNHKSSTIKRETVMLAHNNNSPGSFSLSCALN